MQDNNSNDYLCKKDITTSYDIILLFSYFTPIGTFHYASFYKADVKIPCT